MRVELVENPERFYTKQIRWRGNLIPMLAALPIWVVVLFSQDLWVLVGVAVAFATLLRVGMNRFGLQQNGWLRENLARDADLFVGIETNQLRDPIEPHYDVGGLWLGRDRLRFAGDRVKIEVLRADVKEVRLRSNPHSWVGLGVFVEVVCDHGALRIEERTADTLAGNFRRRWALKSQIEAWARG